MFSLIKYVLLPILAIYLMSGMEETAGQVILNPQIVTDLKKAAKEKCRISFNDEILKNAKQAEDDAKSISNYNNKYPDWDENAVLPDDECHHYYFILGVINVNADDQDDDETVKAYFKAEDDKPNLKSNASVAWRDSRTFAEKKVVNVKGDITKLCSFYNYHGYSFYHKINEVIKTCIGNYINSTHVYPFQ